MMGLRDIGEALPPGFRFYPSDEELVCHYLYKKIANEDVLKGTLMEIDLHTCEPWQLPEMAKLNASEWYFFSFRDRKYTTGYRTNRATTSGYWKATGKDRTVIDPTTREVVGMRKTLVFYRNRAPNGIKTGWIMHEFRLETPHMPPKEDWVLCRVFHKSKESENNISSSSSSDLMNPNPNTFENTTTPPCLSSAKQALSSHLVCQKPLPYGYPHQVPSSSPMNNHQTQSFTNMLNLSSVLNPSPFHFTPEEKNNTAAGSSITELNSIGGSGCDNDDYDFLWSMNMEEDSRFTTSSGQGVAPNLEEGMRLDVDRNSMLFF